jgi:hypothetical protein
LGSFHKAGCPCGFKSSVSVGGSRASFMIDSQFPFYCRKDGLISVNFREQPYKCRWCESTDVQQYGLPPISLLPTGERSWPTLQAWEFKAYREGNLCPQCKQMTLVFSSSELLFD